MRLFQISCFSLLSISLLWLVFPERSDAQQKNAHLNFYNLNSYKGQNFVNFLNDFDTIAYHSNPEIYDKNDVVKTPTDGGIREDIPVKFQEKYQKWKVELLASDYGRAEWEKYSTNKNF